MLHGLTDLSRIEVVSIDKINYLLYVYRSFIRDSLNNIWLMVEIAILLTIYKRYATGGIFTVLQCLDNSNSTAMTSQTANSEAALIKDFIKLFSK